MQFFKFRLCELEDWVNRHGYYPETIFIQIDGASENENKALKAYCELIIARKLGVKELITTRLVVGHTHEDVDAFFGVLWRLYRLEPILTLDHYRDFIVNYFGADRIKVIDVVAIHDYVSFIEPFADRYLARYAKHENEILDYTRLQWRFQDVEVSRESPFGVKTTHRGYAADRVYLITKSDGKDSETERLVNLKIDVRSVSWDPQPSEPSMYILDQLPPNDRTIAMCPLVSKCKESLERVLSNVRRHYQHINREVVANWELFVSKMPQSDNVNDYISRVDNTIHCPLEDELFRGRDLHRQARIQTLPIQTALEQLPSQPLQNHVVWRKHRGTALERFHLSTLTELETIQLIDNVSFVAIRYFC